MEKSRKEKLHLKQLHRQQRSPSVRAHARAPCRSIGHFSCVTSRKRECGSLDERNRITICRGHDRRWILLARRAFAPVPAPRVSRYQQDRLVWPLKATEQRPERNGRTKKRKRGPRRRGSVITRGAEKSAVLSPRSIRSVKNSAWSIGPQPYICIRIDIHSPFSSIRDRSFYLYFCSLLCRFYSPIIRPRSRFREQQNFGSPSSPSLDRSTRQPVTDHSLSPLSSARPAVRVISFSIKRRYDIG